MKRRFGNVEQLPSGRWRARYLVAGEWHNAPRTFFDQYQAQDWLDDQSVDRRRGEWTNPRNLQLPFRKIFSDWKETVVGLRASTLDRDFGYMERYAIPAFGDTPIADIDHELLSRWVADLCKRLAPATVAKALQIVSKVFADAVNRGLIGNNPAASVKAPRIEREEMRFLSADEVESLTEAIHPRYRGVVAIGCWGGLRMSEIFGLKHGAVKNGRVRVTENLVESEGHLYTERCKTRASVRTVTLPKVAQVHLSAGKKTDYVFTSPHGHPVRLKNWRDRFFYPAVEAADLGHLRPHDMRHTCAALLIESGAQPLEVSRVLGHTSVAFTLDRYGHLFDDWGDAVSNRLDALAKRG